MEIDRRCECCPHGPLLVAPAIAAFLALLFNWAVIFDCRFFRVNNFHTSSRWDERVGVGLFFVEDDYDNICYSWDYHPDTSVSDLDGPLKFGRAMCLMAVLFSVPAFTVLLLPSCIRFSRRWLRLLAGFMGVISGLSLLCLIALASGYCDEDSDCIMGPDAALSILAAVLWGIAVVIVLLLKPAENMPAPGVFFQSPPVGPVTTVPQTTTTEVAERIEHNNDGTVTKITTTTTTAPDGSKMVKTTAEVLATAPDGGYSHPAPPTEIIPAIAMASVNQDYDYPSYNPEMGKEDRDNY